MPARLPKLAGAAAAAFVVLSGGPSPAADPERLSRLVADATAGRDAVLGPIVAPAGAAYGQVAALNARLLDEFSRIVSAFAAAPDAQRIAAVKAAVAGFDRETARDGASRTFEGSRPSLSFMRQYAVVQPPGPPESAVSRVMDVVASFERSPKPDDYYFEYSNPRDLAASKILPLRGSDDSWAAKARPPLAPGTAATIKKCRRIVIMGWYCNTATYAREALEPGEREVLATLLRPLAGGDNAEFSGGQAENVVDGYTSLYVVGRAGSMVIVYNLGVQTRAEPPGFTDRLNAGQKEEYRFLLARLKRDLGVEPRF